MHGDKYQIFHTEGAGIECDGAVDGWPQAKELRNTVFHGNGKIRAVWIMRSNPSLDIPPRRYGATLRRTRHEVA